MNKINYEDMSIEEFYQYTNKKIEINYLKDINDKTTETVKIGVITECSTNVIGNMEVEGSTSLSNYKPFICTFIEKDTNQTFRIVAQSINNIKFCE